MIVNFHPMETYKTYYKSPLGPIEIVGAQDNILSLGFVENMLQGDAELPFCSKTCLKQIDEYFKWKRKEFLLNLEHLGTDFQKRVWQQLRKISFGETASYGDIAKAIDNPNASRAVGNANRINPICIITPCHRIIGSDGSLTGYGGGLWRKEWLLKHESGYPPN
ncbi:MAG TPA: methylated-DNA--[protein]-cysteine S-methyltransferase, partial [Desulfobacterales bacterium]|nr:methylated-DNA--[protein]-cysteine S-methyltransferase [Desulfobacterales bacterium]